MEGRIKPSRCPSAPPATRLEAHSKAWTYGPNGCSASRSRWDLRATVAMATSSEAIGAYFAIHSARRFKSPLLHHYSVETEHLGGLGAPGKLAKNRRWS